MAITIEEEKKPVNWITIVITIVLVGVIFLGSYFIFFKKPEIIEIVVPGSLKELNELSKIDFDPSNVINAPAFKILRQFSAVVTSTTPGRSNPFKPF